MAKKLKLTAQDYAEGLALLRACSDQDPRRFALFCAWAEAHTYLDPEVTRSAFARHLVVGDVDRAEKLYAALLENYNPVLGAGVELAMMLAKLAWYGLLFVGAIGGTVYLLRQCG